ncbi:hypothetical protein DACRYDRAFT_23503 [Dacryopinax primogenitus]|uniref:BHLH domain-containing protein n=1 Tax=Dacryopinax primogenitus (strain DJM 731) TaxID=1858805 RepID=M5G269_DACPD|nr:uncharacterized protein DACRYDRAFT_23503 [Dacryopinax primogenitus]EJT99971.1 hypothetical protein DACRYDRAFT_23503 [Dacryopinax primogenitus]
MDTAGQHDSTGQGASPAPYPPHTDFTFLTPQGTFQPYAVGLEFPTAHVGYDHLSGHPGADDPPTYQAVPWPAMHTPMQHPTSFPPPLSISPNALTPPGSGSASGRSSHGEASASPGASPASTSTPPAIGNLSLSHNVGPAHSHMHAHHRAPLHRSSSQQSGNDSSGSHGSTGSMRYVVTGNESSGNESRGHKRRATKHADEDSDDDDDDDLPPRRSSGGNKRDAEADYNRRREEIRKQRIESEQRRRDELREGYRRLKDVLPVSSQKSSKVSLLDRATQHIKQIEAANETYQIKLSQAEAELARLRQINETLMMRSVDVGRHAPGGYAA